MTPGYYMVAFREHLAQLAFIKEASKIPGKYRGQKYRGVDKSRSKGQLLSRWTKPLLIDAATIITAATPEQIDAASVPAPMDNRGNINTTEDGA
jgi:NADH:ubiquinone oxidoreductase subunit